MRKSYIYFVFVCAVPIDVDAADSQNCLCAFFEFSVQACEIC